MRWAVVAALGLSIFIVGCGYVGPVVPPSPMLPVAVSDLAVVERGDKLYINFTTPTATTDALFIKRFSDLELRIGPTFEPFDYTRWAANSRQYVLTPIPVLDEVEPAAVRISKTLPVSEWQGKKIAVAVRTAVKGDTHFSTWSNRVELDVLAPLRPPVMTVDTTRQGYRLTWTPERPGLHYQVRRAGATDKAPVPIGVAEHSEYIDSTSQWETPYVYSVVAQDGPSVESLPSEGVPVKSPDKFPPSVPTDVTVLSGPDSVELSWTRSPEPDLKGYLVYRSAGGAPFAVVGELTTIPTFSDRKAEHGRTYRYAISSVDNNSNESEKSLPVEVTF